MVDAKNKNISDRAKRSEFDIEEDFQDTTRPNAKPSEPGRATDMKQPAGVNKDTKTKAASVQKR